MVLFLKNEEWVLDRYAPSIKPLQIFLPQSNIKLISDGYGLTISLQWFQMYTMPQP